MKLDEIRALAAIVKETGLESLTITEGDFHISLKMPTAAVSAPESAAPAVPAEAPAAVAVPAPQGEVIASPMVGIFYAAPSPESAPYVTVGQKVKKGDVLCIVEAMKLMNEIQAEQDGEIAEICAENGQVVEFGQPLFRIR